MYAWLYPQSSMARLDSPLTIVTFSSLLVVVAADLSDVGVYCQQPALLSCRAFIYCPATQKTRLTMDIEGCLKKLRSYHSIV